MRSVLGEAITNVTSMDNGFFYNLKELTLRPYQIVQDYIDGRRRYILNPITYLLICTTLYIILEELVPNNNIHIKDENVNRDALPYQVGYQMSKFFNENFKFFWVAIAFFLAFANRITFKKYNYSEHVAISAFIFGHATLFGILGFLILKKEFPFNIFPYLAIIWMNYKVFNKEDGPIVVFITAFLSTFLFLFQMAFALLLCGLVLALLNG